MELSRSCIAYLLECNVAEKLHVLGLGTERTMCSTVTKHLSKTSVEERMSVQYAGPIPFLLVPSFLLSAFSQFDYLCDY